MKKYAFYRWRQEYLLGDIICFVLARDESEAWVKLTLDGRWTNTPVMVGKLMEVEEFKQPSPIPVI